MALFTIKPSRGTVGFFALLIIGLVARAGMRRHETALVARDLPHSHATRRLLRCVLGRDALGILQPRPGLHGIAAPTWDASIDDRLRAIVHANWSPAWPARCVPIAERLAARLEASPDARLAWSPSREVLRLLTDSARSPLAAIQHADDGSLATQLASLATHVNAISHGAAEGWESPLPPAPTDLDPVRTDPLPTPAPLPDDARYATLALPDLLLYQSGRDGLLHAITYRADAPRGSDRVLGPGAPVADDPRDGPMRIDDDHGEDVLLPGGEPALRVHLPDVVANGREALGDWQIALSSESLWLLTDDTGVLRLRTTLRQGEVHWSDAPVASLGDPDTMLAGLMVPSRDGDTVSIAALRRGARGILVEQRTVHAATPDGAATVDPSRTLVDEWPAFAAHAVTCSAGATVRYALVTSDEQSSVVSFDGVDAYRMDLPAPRVAPTSQAVLACAADAALVTTDPNARENALLYVDRATRRVIPLDPPRSGRDARVVASTLLDDGAVVALVDNGTTLRVWRSDSPARPGREWTGGAVLAMQYPATALRADPDDVRHLGVLSLRAQGSQLAMLAQVDIGRRTYTGRLASRDRGETWR